VFGTGDDPVKIGLVTSFNQPGGNATGISFFSNELVSKRLELLRELVPTAKRVAVLVNPTDKTNNEPVLHDLETAATGLQILPFEAASGREIDAAFERLANEKAEALFLAPTALFSARRVQVAILAARYALPATFSSRNFVEAGGLMSYGTNLPDSYRQVALYVGRILKGAKPAAYRSYSRPSSSSRSISTRHGRSASRSRRRFWPSPTRWSNRTAVRCICSRPGLARNGRSICADECLFLVEKRSCSGHHRKDRF
jgi:ABC-type uncharacterized transport system substrate-binding protein